MQSTIDDITGGYDYANNIPSLSNGPRYDDGSNNKHQAVLFEGSHDLFRVLREKHREKMMSQPFAPGCNTTELRTNEIKLYNKAMEIDWIGRDLSAVTTSCQFTGVDFPPTSDTLNGILSKGSYVTVFHMAGQCESAFQWEEEKPMSCLGNNFGGTLGYKTKGECIHQSVGGQRVQAWIDANAESAMKCLGLYLKEEEEDSFIGRQSVDIMRGVELAARNTTNIVRDNVDSLTGKDLIRDGFGRGTDEEWNALAFTNWANATLLSALGSGSETLRITKQLASELNKHVQSGSISDSVSGWYVSHYVQRMTSCCCILFPCIIVFRVSYHS